MLARLKELNKHPRYRRGQIIIDSQVYSIEDVKNWFVNKEDTTAVAKRKREEEEEKRKTRAARLQQFAFRPSSVAVNKTRLSQEQASNETSTQPEL